jgi:CheY-like chemotaxis protein
VCLGKKGEFEQATVRKGLEMQDLFAKTRGGRLYSSLSFGKPDVRICFADTHSQAAAGVHPRGWMQALRVSAQQPESAGRLGDVADHAARSDGSSNVALASGHGRELGDSVVMSAKGATSILSGITVLVVEDNFLVGDLFRLHLQSYGATVIGPAASIAEASDLLDANASRIDVAVLDVDLNGELITPIAERLMVIGKPFLFVTALGTLDPLPAELQSHPRVEKPLGVANLAVEVAALVGR